MPKGKRAARAVWLCRGKPAVASDLDTYSRFSISINYNEAKAEGSITVHCPVSVEGTEQTLSLVLRPENITSCDLTLDVRRALPLEMLNMIPSISTPSDVVCLTLLLHTPGPVICPMVDLPLSLPVNDGQEPAFVAFSRLCQSKTICIYLGKPQIQDFARLPRFVSDLSSNALRANSIDLRCLGGGRGAQETTWSNIYPSEAQHAQLNAVAAEEHAIQTRDLAEEKCRSSKPHLEGILNTRRPEPLRSLKRHLDVSNEPQACYDEPASKMQKLFWDDYSLGSPTEVNTPSTRQPSASISTPTSKHDVPLPPYSASPNPKYPPISSSTTTISPSTSSNSINPASFLYRAPDPPPNPDLTKTITQILHNTLPQIIQETLQTLLPPLLSTHLHPLLTHQISHRLPALTSSLLSTHLDTLLSDLTDSHRTAEINFGEVVEDAKVEVKEVRDEAVGEIEGVKREMLDGFVEEVEEVKMAAFDELSEKTRFLEGRLERRARVLGRGLLKEREGVSGRFDRCVSI